MSPSLSCLKTHDNCIRKKTKLKRTATERTERALAAVLASTGNLTLRAFKIVRENTSTSNEFNISIFKTAVLEVYTLYTRRSTSTYQQSMNDQRLFVRKCRLCL